MKRFLFISYVFPPIAYVGSHRTLRLCKYLSRMGHEVTVVTIRVQPDLDNDPTLLEKLGDGMAIVRTRTWDPWRWHQNLKLRLSANVFGKTLDRIIGLMIRWTSIPDHMVFWIPFAFIRSYALLKAKKHDVVVTSSPPHSSQVIGLLLRKFFPTKWIADLRDPIFENVLSDGWSVVEKTANGALDRCVLRHADAVIANTRREKERLERRSQRANVHWIPNSFDEDDFRDIPRQKYGKFTVAHVGSFYYGSLDILMEALQILDREGALFPADFRFLFVGFTDGRTEKAVRAYGIGKYVEVKGYVPHREAVEIMCRSHVLLLIKGFGPYSAGHVPAKLYEYLATGNRIVCIGPDDSEAADIIRSAETGVIVGSAGKLSEALSAEYEKYKNRFAFFRDLGATHIRHEYSSESMARKLIGLA